MQWKQNLAYLGLGYTFRQQVKLKYSKCDLRELLKILTMEMPLVQ